MDKRIAAIVVLAVLFLSAGPLGFFGGSGAKKLDVNDTGGDDRPLQETVSAEVIGVVEDVTPVLIYRFTSGRLNEPLVRERFSRIAGIRNFSISSGINPAGEGYQYVVTANFSDPFATQVAGFKMVYWMSDFSTSQDSFPMMAGKARLDGEFTATRKNGSSIRVSTKGNKTVNLVLYYWNKNQTQLAIRCPNIVISSQSGAFLRSTVPCVNVLQPSKELFGLPSEYSQFVEEFTLPLKVNVTDVLEQHFEGRVAPDANESKLKELMLPAYDQREYDITVTPNETSESLPKFLMRLSIKTENELKIVRDAMQRSGYRMISEWRVGQVDLNRDNVTIGLTEYDLGMVNSVSRILAKLKKDTPPGERQLSITFRVIYLEVISAIGEEL
ncbi:hypothetical protein HYS54_00765 [Candidatus Micrarchaeota archaeon]|nr:hypothetical protein [Candidatus Micrarchaeota archaeon]